MNLDETSAKALARIEELGGPNWEFAPLDKFSRQDRVTTKLINNELLEFSVRAASREFIFELNEPFYIAYIEIHVDRTSSTFIEGHFEPIDSDKLHPTKFKRKAEDNIYIAHVNTVCDSFRFKPPKRYLVPADRITKVAVAGLSLESLADAVSIARSFSSNKASTIKEIEDATSSAKSLIEREDTLEDSVQKLDAKREGLETELQSLDFKKSQAADSVGVLEGKIGELSDRETRINSRIDQANSEFKDKESQLSQIRKSITEKQTELRGLEAQANLFPSEFSGYVDNAKNTVTLYWKLSVVPIAALSILTGFVLSGAVDLTVRYSKGEDFDLIALLASRLPFAIIVAALASAFFRLAKYLIEEIIRIGRQQLAFTRLSVIAKEVNDASKDGLDLTDDQIVEARNHLRMELIKNHLSLDLTPDFKMQTRLKDLVSSKLNLRGSGGEKTTDIVLEGKTHGSLESEADN